MMSNSRAWVWLALTLVACGGGGGSSGGADDSDDNAANAADSGTQGGGNGGNGGNDGNGNDGAGNDGTGSDGAGGDGNASSGDAGAGGGTDKPVVRMAAATLVIHDTSRLTIGTTLPEFAYKGGENKGTLSDHGDGTATVFFPAAGNTVTPLEVIPGGLGQVEIVPNDMTGEIDFCTGIMTMPFDAQFTPTIFGTKQKSMHVVTDLTTETSMGMTKTLMGKRLDKDGNLKLVGVAVVPKTDDITVDGLLGLPADAATDMDGTLMVEGGLPKCPTSK